MTRLETVEDFERIAKALADTSASFSDFFVFPHGFCRSCNMVTTYEPAVVGFRQIINLDLAVQCTNCGTRFEVPNGFLSQLYLTGEDVPEEYREEVTMLNSREEQIRSFSNILDIEIKRSKREEKGIRQKIRRLAKLRS